MTNEFKLPFTRYFYNESAGLHFLLTDDNKKVFESADGITWNQPEINDCCKELHKLRTVSRISEAALKGMRETIRQLNAERDEALVERDAWKDSETESQTDLKHVRAELASVRAQRAALSDDVQRLRLSAENTQRNFDRTVRALKRANDNNDALHKYIAGE